MKTLGKVLVPVALILASVSAAQAHAQLERADPRVGSTVRAAPPALMLYFTEGVEAAFSSVQVTDGSGSHFEAGKPRVDKGDPRQVQVPLKSLPAGQYNVHWRVVSVDTHRTEGSFSFEVRP